MLIEALVLGSQNGVFHDFWNIGNFREITSLFAKFADQKTVSRVNPQRDFGPVVSQLIQGREAWVSNDGGGSNERCDSDSNAENDCEREREPLEYWESQWRGLKETVGRGS